MRLLAPAPAGVQTLTRCVSWAEHGDLPRPLPKVDEITKAAEVFEFSGTGSKWWDYDAATKRWGWTRPPPESQKSGEEVRLRPAAA